MLNRRIAVLIGNNEFPHEPGLSTLRCSLNDVDGMARILGSKDRGRFDEVIVLADKSSHEIIKKLEDVFRAADKSDLILIYYAGHGKLSRSKVHLHLAANDTTLDSLSSTSVSINTLKALIEDSQTKKIIIILDCCHSGAIRNDFLRGDPEDELRQLSEGQGIFIMTACTLVQQAEENPSDRHGIFTRHIIEGIEHGAADDDNNGLITTSELYRYVEKRVKEEKPNQQPTHYGLDQRGDLVVARISEKIRQERNRNIRALLKNMADYLPGRILAKAYEITDLPPDQLTGALREYDRLLEHLCDQKITVSEFLEKWDAVKADHSEPPAKEPVKRLETPTLPEETITSRRRPVIYAVIIFSVITIGGAFINNLTRTEPELPQVVQEIPVKEEKREEPPASATGSLTIITDPKNAKIRILNLLEKFYQGINLPPGRYQIEVAAKGYETIRQWIKIDSGERVKAPIKLDRSAPPPKITSSLGMEMVYIRPGVFMMGSPSGETDREVDEIRHQVTLTKGFYIQTTEVTQAQWKAVMQSNPSNFKTCGDDCPVENVSWGDARIFIQKLNLREKELRYRLPTEAEWEYAARAGSNGRFSFGDDSEGLKQHAWFDDNSLSIIHPVAQKRPNQQGLYDMHGNVWEWVEDWYGDYAPGRVTDPSGPSNGTFRVVRGGSWSSAPESCRSALRNWDPPGARSDELGFRPAADPLE